MVTIVRLDTPEEEVAPLAEKLTQWLVNEGVVSANPNKEKSWRPSDWIPGPRWRDVVEESSWNDSFTMLANNGVDVAEKRLVHHPVENYETPACQRCGAMLADELHHDLIEPWLAGDERTGVCPKCGWSALIGDWRGDSGFAVGAPGDYLQQLADLQELGEAKRRRG